MGFSKQNPAHLQSGRGCRCGFEAEVVEVEVEEV